MATFRSYNPLGTHARSHYSRACESCYARKVQCDTSGASGGCSNCLEHGFVCKPRLRRRKDQNRRLSQADLNKTKPQHHGRNDGSSPVLDQARQQQNCHTFTTSPAHSRTEAAVSGHTTSSAPLLFIHHCVAASSPMELVAAASSPRLDEFYNSSYLSRRAVLGDDFPDIDHSHGGRQPHAYTLTENDMKVLELYNAFDLPSLPVRQALFETFYERCWTWMPVVDDDTVMADISHRASSLLVLQAVLLAATSTKPDSDMILPPHPQYRRVKAIVDTGAERNPLNLLAALCLMQFYAPAAPKDISTHTPRFWGTYALGLAVQMGLNRKTTKYGGQNGRRRRIWWTLYARDSIMSAAHGRPRIINPADCGVEPPSVHDFPDPNDLRAQIFVSYVSITSILCDLCQLLTRQNNPPFVEKNQIGLRLLEYVRSLPPALRLVQPNGPPKPYSFDLAQLHIHLLTSIIILYRPQSIFHVPPASAPAIVAANLNFRIFEAIELRGHTCFLSSGFAWHLLVNAIPQISCLGIPALREEFKGSLDSIEGVLRTLASTRPAAANNLRNIQVIRRALETKDGLLARGLSANVAQDVFSFSPLDLFDPYGGEVPKSYDRIAAALEASHSNDIGGQNFENVSQGNQNVPQIPDTQTHSFAATPNQIADETIFHDFPGLLGSNFPEDGWMRNWIDEANLFNE